MKSMRIDPEEAIDILRDRWIPEIDDHCDATLHRERNGDQYMVIYDPLTDRTLVFCRIKNSQGRKLLQQAKSFLNSNVNPG